MRDWLERWKPAAPIRGHLLASALLWSLVGTLLATFGGRWLAASGLAHAGAWGALAVALGLLKSRLVLDRAAGRGARRILERGDGRCLGGFLSPASWLLVALMAGGGRALRAWVLSPWAAGLLYLGVGAALLGSSRVYWRAWAGAGRAQRVGA